MYDRDDHPFRIAKFSISFLLVVSGFGLFVVHVTIIIL
jgi:hypothetical protein